VKHPVTPGGRTLEIAGIVRSSLVDGPGHRFVLFLQGCNFDCIACHNPSTIGRCTGCGVCVEFCPHGALDVLNDGEIIYDPAACDHCRACIAPCPIDADPSIRLATVDEIAGEIGAVAGFIGGVTVTGGEPTLQLEALVALFEVLGADPATAHLTRLLDTNGTLDRAGWERLAPVMEGAMVDLKAGTDDVHRRITGHDIGPVRQSIVLLHRMGRLAEIRLLVVPGVTDTAEELTAWAGFVHRVDATIPVRLMGFRHSGTRTIAHRWPEATPGDVDRVRTHLTTLGLTNLQP
jgi:pyruvate formate lyase activating enzyme